MSDAWSATQQEYPRHLCIHDLFEAQAARTPDSCALISGTPWVDQQLSYRELDQRANQLAQLLRQRGVGVRSAQGVADETPVGVCVRRSPAMVVALLAILKAGGAYVPLDPSYPPERIRYMLADAGCPVLLVDSGYAALQATLDAADSSSIAPAVLDLDADWPLIAAAPTDRPDSALSPEQLAYVIYTSGSTGRPKGVAISHRSAVAFISWALTVFQPEQLRGVLAGTSICFDLSVFELFVTLSGGGTVILAENVLELPRLAAAQTVTLINSVPSAVTELLRLHAIPPSVQTINLAGEPLPLRLVQQLYRLPTVGQVLNLYGPSEDTTYSTCALIPPDTTRAPTIGYPISNTQAYILDAQLQPLPIGEVGELYLGGDGLARGYLNRPALTAERFIPNPFSTSHGARLYKTGDLARYRADGQIEFLGRADQQVKLRGFRIELGEIEHALAQHPAVRDVAVLARDQRLVAYVVGERVPAGQTKNQEPNGAHAESGSQVLALGSELRAFLAQRLPEYMLPSAFVLLPTLPRTPNGKLDRAALPLPAPSRSTLDTAYVPPRSPEEAALAAIWAQVLGVEQVGIHDHFIALGGHSLHATRIIARMQERWPLSLTVRTLFEQTTVAELAAVCAAEQRPDLPAPPLVAQARDGAAPASFAQQRLWFLDQLSPGNPAYNIPIALRVAGPLDHVALQRSLSRIVRRHEVLRTVFDSVDGQPVPRVTEHSAVELSLTDVSALPAEQQLSAALERAREISQQPFDLAHDSFLRAALLRLGSDDSHVDHLLVLVIHHIVADDWSMGVLFHELGALYAAEQVGHADPLPELAVQYADFALWQRRWLAPDAPGGLLTEQLAYWKRQLAGAPFGLELPADRPRPTTPSFNGATYSFVLPQPIAQGLHTLTRQAGATLFMTLLAALDVLLYRYTGQDDIVVGSSIAGRTRAEVEPLIGFFINTLLLRSDLSGNPTFRQLLGRVRETCLEAYAHQELPFELLVEALQPTRDLSGPPLPQVMLVHQNAPMPPLALPGLTVTPIALDNGTAKVDLTVYVAETSEGLSCTLEYTTDLFDVATIARMAGHLATLLEQIVARPDASVATLDLLTAAERQHLVVDWNASAADYPRDQRVHQLFEAQAARQPDTPAVVFQGQQLSYGQLNARANQLAHHLRQRGVGPDTLVALCVERSLDMLVGILGVLKAGGAYVPLDPAYPAARLQFMVADAQAPLLLTQAHLVAQLPPLEADLLRLDADWTRVAQQPTTNLPVTTSADHGAYVIYTSGSTGQPKGVLVRHGGLLNLCFGLRAFFADPAVVNTGLITSISFDISVNQIFPTLVFGRTLHLVPEPVKLDSPALRRFLVEHQIQLLDGVPSYLQAVLKDTEHLALGSPLRFLLIGGEKLEPALCQAVFEQLGPQVAIVNIYGLTEISDINALSVLRASDPPGPVTVGQPLQNNRIYLTDAHGNLVPVGVPGELCIAGESLGRGYLGRPALTAEKYVPCPFEDGERMCRTGDLGRRLPDGRIVVLGRRDAQVKIRGYRIELGEVEAALREHPALREGVVVARPDAQGQLRLVAYVVSSGPSTEPGALRAFLAQRLPEYMVPSLFITLDALPRTPNGKLDRRSLPEPPSAADLDAYVAPRTSVETVLASMWCDALQLPQVGIYSNFFDLGGHSLNATRVVSRIRQAFQVDLAVRDLFATPTVAALAERMVATEPQPGRTDKIARALQRIRQMSVSDRQQMLQQKKGSEHS